MRTAADAIRSLNRYVALALGPQWEVRMATEKGTFNRPYARTIQVPSIEVVTEAFMRVRIQSAYQIVAFPEQGATAEDGLMNALAAVEALTTALAPGVDMGRTARIPLYDYAGIPLTGPDAAATETNRDPRDFMKLEGQADIVPYQDPDDDTLWSVAANIRMSWLRSAAVPSAAPMTVSVGVEASNG